MVTRRRKRISGDVPETTGSVDSESSYDSKSKEGKPVVVFVPSISKRVNWDLVLPLLILGVSMAVRFFKLSHPRSCVFDEVHFGKFTDWYIKREFFFDIHPPLGKLVHAGLGTLLGYQPNKAQYKYIGQGFARGETFYILRGISAFFGSFVPVFAFMTCRELDLTLDASLLTAVLIVFENMLVIESRLILLDSQLMFYISLTLMLAFKLWKAPEGSIKKIGLTIATGLAGSCAISVKWTAGVTPLIIAFTSFCAIVFPEVPLSLLHCLLAGGTAFLLYTLIHVIHFAVLNKSGQGDPFMSEPFRATLKGSEWYGKIKPVGFWKNYYELTQCMFWTNKGTTQPHPYMSKWYEWPLPRKGMTYLSNRVPAGKISEVFLLTNPFVSVLTVTAIAATILLCLIYSRYRLTPSFHKYSRTVSVATFFVISWILNLLPYAAVERSAFLYHYLPGLYYAQILVAVLINPLPSKMRAVVVIIASLATIACFVYWSPLVYGLQTSTEGNLRLRRLQMFK